MSKQQFDNDGFVCVRAMLDNDTTEAVEQTLTRLAVPGAMAQSDVFVEERNGKPKQLQNLHTYAPELFLDVVYRDKVLPLAKELSGGREPSLVKNVQLFVKHPLGASGPTRVHQDDWYFQLDESLATAMTVWIALDDADENSGCLRYAKGSHKCGLAAHEPNKAGRWRTRSGVQGFAGYVSDVQLEDLETPVPVKRGDAVVHHCRALHGAGGNTSANIRRALTFILFFDLSNKAAK